VSVTFESEFLSGGSYLEVLARFEEFLKGLGYDRAEDVCFEEDEEGFAGAEECLQFVDRFLSLNPSEGHLREALMRHALEIGQVADPDQVIDPAEGNRDNRYDESTDNFVRAAARSEGPEAGEFESKEEPVADPNNPRTPPHAVKLVPRAEDVTVSPEEAAEFARRKTRPRSFRVFLWNAQGNAQAYDMSQVREARHDHRAERVEIRWHGSPLRGDKDFDLVLYGDLATAFWDAYLGYIRA
jgi:hypothetical protein